MGCSSIWWYDSFWKFSLKTI
uniref:Uncharacterized protein n=1 Tax=Rhizophora mucronata TaxID=61149 RepID=A0A2P2PZV5_RHIMU